MAKGWRQRWFASHESAKLFVRSIWDDAWGVEMRKVNAANRKYNHGFTVRWYWRNGVPAERKALSEVAA